MNWNVARRALHRTTTRSTLTMRIEASWGRVLGVVMPPIIALTIKSASRIACVLSALHAKRRRNF